MEKARWPLLIWVRLEVIRPRETRHAMSTFAEVCCFGMQALFGTSLTMADGILTPAVSVTSAVTGIAVVRASVASDVVPISIVRLHFHPCQLLF